MKLLSSGGKRVKGLAPYCSVLRVEKAAEMVVVYRRWVSPSMSKRGCTVGDGFPMPPQIHPDSQMRGVGLRAN